MNREIKEFMIIADAYRNYKRFVREIEDGIIHRSKGDYERSCYIVNHIEYVITGLQEKYALIIRNDLKYGPGSKWYLEMMSQSYYYANRKLAYREFLRCLEQ